MTNMKVVFLLLLTFQAAYCDSCNYRIFEIRLNHTPLRWGIVTKANASNIKHHGTCYSTNLCLLKSTIHDTGFEDNVNGSVAINDRVWLGRDTESPIRYLLCCQTDKNGSNYHGYCNEDMLTAVVLRATMQRRIAVDALGAPQGVSKVPFRYYAIGCSWIFCLAVAAHVITCVFYMCKMDRHTPIPAMKEEHDTAALYEQNAALPQLFPTKVPSQIAASVVKTAIENESESAKTGQKGRTDETTLIELTASNAENNKMSAAQLRDEVFRTSAVTPSATGPSSTLPKMDSTQSATPPPTLPLTVPGEHKKPIAKLPTKQSASSLDKTQSLIDNTQIGSSEPVRNRRRQSRETITLTTTKKSK